MKKARVGRRFDETPDRFGPELHGVIARWLRSVARTRGADRDRRTRDALAALADLTGWTEAEARRAMAAVANDLSPSCGQGAKPVDKAGPRRPRTIH